MRLQCPECSKLFNPVPGEMVTCPACGYSTGEKAPGGAAPAGAAAAGGPPVAAMGGPPGATSGPPPGFSTTKAPVSAIAVASLIVGILGLCAAPGSFMAFIPFIGEAFGWVFGLFSLLSLVALVLGFVARKQIKDKELGGDGMAIAGIVLGLVGFLVAAFMGIFFFALFNSF